MGAKTQSEMFGQFLFLQVAYCHLQWKATMTPSCPSDHISMFYTHNLAQLFKMPDNKELERAPWTSGSASVTCINKKKLQCTQLQTCKKCTPLQTGARS